MDENLDHLLASTRRKHLERLIGGAQSAGVVTKRGAAQYILATRARKHVLVQIFLRQGPHKQIARMRQAAANDNLLRINRDTNGKLDNPRAK